MTTLIKWSHKVVEMNKIYNQCYLGLKQPKIAEKCHFYGTFKPFLQIWMQFSVLDMKGVSRGDIDFWTSKYEEKLDKLPWIYLSSTKNALVIPLIFHVFSPKSEKKIFEKKMIKKVGFLTMVH